MKNNFTGYRVPKTLDYSKLTIKKNLSFIPKINQDDYYFIFYNNELELYNIPQNCNNKNKQELKDLKKFLNFIKDLPITKEEITEMLLPLAKELRVLHTKKEELENKKRLLDYEKLQKSGKFIIKRQTIPQFEE